MNTQSKLLIPLVAVLAIQAAAAGESELTGFVGIDSQAFLHEARYPGQHDGLNASLLLRPEFYWRSEEGSQRISVVGFARLDANDSERTHADLREAYWGVEGNGWDLVAGINKVFWGVAESRHLVDVINQADLVEDIDQEEKLGQPMINFNVDTSVGRLEFFALPFFRERTFPGINGRYRGPLPVDADSPIYESPDGQDHLDLAVRYSHYIGDVDLGAHVFEGTSREPRFELAPEHNRLIPVYEQMTQAGFDLQYTRDAWLWKLEAIYRDATSGTFTAAVAGFEYTLYGITDSGADLGLLAEYLHDDRNEAAPPTVFDNDLFVGARYAANDANDTSVLAGAVTDLDTGEFFVNIEAERRIGDSLNIELRARAFMNTGPNDSLYALENDDYVQLRLQWYY